MVIVIIFYITSAKNGPSYSDQSIQLTVLATFRCYLISLGTLRKYSHKIFIFYLLFLFNLIFKCIITNKNILYNLGGKINKNKKLNIMLELICLESFFIHSDIIIDS